MPILRKVATMLVLIWIYSKHETESWAPTRKTKSNHNLILIWTTLSIFKKEEFWHIADILSSYSHVWTWVSYDTGHLIAALTPYPWQQTASFSFLFLFKPFIPNTCNLTYHTSFDCWDTLVRTHFHKHKPTG